MFIDRHMSDALDRHITGNYGEDQFSEPDDKMNPTIEPADLGYAEIRKAYGVKRAHGYRMSFPGARRDYALARVAFLIANGHDIDDAMEHAWHEYFGEEEEL